MKQRYDFSNAERGRFHRPNAKLNMPASGAGPAWEGAAGRIGCFVVDEARKTLGAYQAQPRLVIEHANHEYGTAHGGYAHRQLFELVQNSADALSHTGTGQSILIRLTEEFLYCADDGKPIDRLGVKGLMFAHMSSKRGTNEIGRFGLGFKSVLGVSDAPEFFSRSGSLRFDGKGAAERISQVAKEDHYPSLRLPDPIDPIKAMSGDDELRELMGWATNIVRLPLKADAHSDLAAQIRCFPPEFLLFVPHVRYLSLEVADEKSREFTLREEDGEFRLDTGKGATRWRRFTHSHQLSAEAQADSRLLDDSSEVPIAWAAPLDRRDDLGYFWAFFPTQTASLLAGILNAPWKTNEDRQNLLPCPYNDELIDAAAELVTNSLPKLSLPADPAKHLDALPRREAAGDGEHSKRLREKLIAILCDQPVVPDQDGCLRGIKEVSYAPEALTADGLAQEPLDQWSSYGQRPRNWTHHTALTRNRLAKLDQLFHQEDYQRTCDRWGGWNWRKVAPRASVEDWLAALKNEWPDETVIAASKAAIRVASLIPVMARRESRDLGEIVLTQSGNWLAPDPRAVFLPASEYEHGISDELVHVELASDPDTENALRALGLETVSDKRRFQSAVERLPQYGSKVDSREMEKFWVLARAVGADDVFSGLKGKEKRLRVRTMSGEWRHLDAVLLPGEMVPGDGNRDNQVTVDVDFHADDEDLLSQLGVVQSPREKDLSTEPWYNQFLSECRKDYKSRDLSSNPQDRYLGFSSTIGNGPLHVLTCLSDEGKALYTDALLSSESSYQKWVMGHETQGRIYPEIPLESPVLIMLRKHGRIRCKGGFAAFGDALGKVPNNSQALRVLLSHPMAEYLRNAFVLAEPTFEAVGEEDPIPLTDVWPGLPPKWSSTHLVRCQRILGEDGSKPTCIRLESSVLLVATGDDFEDLRLVTDELGLRLSNSELHEILHHVTQDEIDRQRTLVREQTTDAGRLLCAVGKEALRSCLPSSLLSVLEANGASVTGIQVAEAAIATFHTGALKECKLALEHLNPPRQWAGSPRSVEFVQSLGFAPEWAGERSVRRAPFVEVGGPYSLPELHPYQRVIVNRVASLFSCGDGNGADRRGMVSLPTGAGKTRVAVQAIVEAIRDGIYAGGVLWVADRDELCEQAVEAWRQVWSAKGASAAPLRISRMWAGQPAPLATSDFHVVVATIQTLNARLANGGQAYRFLTNFKLVVFDEAHRSVAPTFTSVMSEIGLTRWRKAEEPFLLGLTATPYRGYDESETTRLVNRYGSNRLDSGAFVTDDPMAVVQELQDMQVLAQADHETIDGGDFSLEANEIEQLEAMPRLAWLPRSVEERIAGDATRTLRIVDAYESHVRCANPDWPTLIFATSVEHAQTVAALLNTRGVKSRAVSGETETAIRRRVVDEFRRGEIKALVNYGVFREGFDAPKTRAIVVARPVYSPNLYFQMVGRGLRGPKNGGSDRCLIINVRDNIDNFNRQLAFADLDWLWA